MSGLWGDVRFGLRGWRKNPGFSVVATLTLALGIGLTTAIFSLVNAVLFRPLPIAGIERLVGVYNVGTSGFLSHEPLAYPDYVALRDGATSLSSRRGTPRFPSRWSAATRTRWFSARPSRATTSRPSA